MRRANSVVWVVGIADPHATKTERSRYPAPARRAVEAGNEERPVPEVNKVSTPDEAAPMDEGSSMDVMDASTTHAYSAAEVTAAASVGSTQWDRDEDRRGSE